MLHALLHNNKLIGLFSNYKKCMIMMNGLITNNFVQKKNIIIKSYVENSITEGEYHEIDNMSDEDNLIIEDISSVCTTESYENMQDDDIQDNTLMCDTHKKEKVNSPIQKVKLNDEQIKEKCELQNSINELKKKKEKLEESKRVFDVDLSLYKKFKELKNANINFNIPDMFIEKYKLMNDLDNQGKLNWFNFNELYKPVPISTSFSKVFENEHNMTVPY
jgi:hypothetical protein